MNKQIEVGDIWRTANNELAIVTNRTDETYCLKGAIIGEGPVIWTEEGKVFLSGYNDFDLKEYVASIYDLLIDTPCNPPQKSLTISPDGKTTVSITININQEK